MGTRSRSWAYWSARRGCLAPPACDPGHRGGRTRWGARGDTKRGVSPTAEEEVGETTTARASHGCTVLGPTKGRAGPDGVSHATGGAEEFDLQGPHESGKGQDAIQEAPEFVPMTAEERVAGSEAIRGRVTTEAAVATSAGTGFSKEGQHAGLETTTAGTTNGERSPADEREGGSRGQVQTDGRRDGAEDVGGQLPPLRGPLEGDGMSRDEELVLQGPRPPLSSAGPRGRKRGREHITQ